MVLFRKFAESGLKQMKFDVLTINTAVEIFGLIICMIIIFCRRFAVTNLHKKVQTDFTLLVLCEAFILFFGAVTGLLTGNDTQPADTFLPVCCFMKNLFTYLLLGIFTNYVVHSFMSDRGLTVQIIVWILILISIAALSFNFIKPIYYYVDSSNVCQKGDLYFVSQLPCVIIYLENLIYIIIHRKKVSKSTFLSFLMYMIIPICALVLQIFLYSIDILNMALIVVLMVMFVIMQNQLVDEYIEQKRQLQENGFRLMVSQIKPHFIFNSLTAIAQLCDENPSLAKETTISFGKYLRGNLSALEKPESVPFEDELNHIKNYLSIESVRFGEYLNIVYDIETVDFRVPVLSIQPLIENAVKHGVGMKEEGGTVTLSVHRNGNNVEIKILDDGVGFDTSAPYDGKDHIGISSSIKRLKQICGAETKIESTVGKGTEITVSIPV